MMRNVVVIVLALVALGIVAPAARADKYDDLAVKVAELQKSLGDLEALVKSLTYEVQQSQGFGEILKQLSFEMKKTEASISNLTVFEKRVNVEVFPTLMNLQTSVAGLVTSTQEKLDALAGRIFTAETNLDQFGVRVSTLEERTKKLMELQDRVAKIEEAIKQMTGQKPGMASETVDKLNKAVQALDAKVTQLANGKSDKTEIEQLKKRVEAAEGGSGTANFAMILALLSAIAAGVALFFAIDP